MVPRALRGAAVAGSRRICRHPGCPGWADGTGYCPRHQVEAWKPRDRRASAAARGYDSTWRTWASGFRFRHPWCEECAKEGRRVPTAVVDHRETREVMYLKHGGETFQDQDYAGLCHHHNLLKARQVDPEIRRANGLEPYPSRRGVGG